jgi:hypothetical protein
MENEISVACESTRHFQDACSLFEFQRNPLKSSKNEWFGTLRAVRKLDYLEKSFYQLFAVAKVNGSCFNCVLRIDNKRIDN